jgi:uncharacterized BrkB/YihY/UPF0761 family membrane protein
MIFVKSFCVGLLASVGVLLVLGIAAVIGLMVASRMSSGAQDSIGWDPISLRRPLPALLLILLPFVLGFWWEYRRLTAH